MYNSVNTVNNSIISIYNGSFNRIYNRMLGYNNNNNIENNTENNTGINIVENHEDLFRIPLLRI